MKLELRVLCTILLIVRVISIDMYLRGSLHESVGADVNEETRRLAVPEKLIHMDKQEESLDHLEKLIHNERIAKLITGVCSHVINS